MKPTSDQEEQAQGAEKWTPKEANPSGRELGGSQVGYRKVIGRFVAV